MRLCFALLYETQEKDCLRSTWDRRDDNLSTQTNASREKNSSSTSDAALVAWSLMSCATPSRYTHVAVKCQMEELKPTKAHFAHCGEEPMSQLQVLTLLPSWKKKDVRCQVPPPANCRPNTFPRMHTYTIGHVELLFGEIR